MSTYVKKELVVVTGGAGFIGSHVVGKLLALGHRVAVIDNFRTGKHQNLKDFRYSDALHIYEFDIVSELHQAMAKITKEHGAVDRIIHLAAQTSVAYSIAEPLEDLQINYYGTLKLLEYAKKHSVKKVVFASSAAVYGDLEAEKITEEHKTSPISPYGIHKLSSENLLSSYGNNHGLATTAFRFFNVYGPRQDPSSDYSGVISIFLDRAVSGSDLLIFGSGEQTRDFIYVDDIARTLVDSCFCYKSNNKVYNLGTGQAISIKTLAEQILLLSRSTSEIHHREKRAGDILHSCADISLAIQDLQFEIQTPLRSGLQKTIEWYQASQSEQRTLFSLTHSNNSRAKISVQL